MRLFTHRKYFKGEEFEEIMQEFNELEKDIIKAQLETYRKLLNRFTSGRYKVINFYMQLRFLNQYAEFIQQDMKRKETLENHLLEVFYNPAYKFCRDRLNRQYDEYELTE